MGSRGCDRALGLGEGILTLCSVNVLNAYVVQEREKIGFQRGSGTVPWSLCNSGGSVSGKRAQRGSAWHDRETGFGKALGAAHPTTAESSSTSISRMSVSALGSFDSWAAPRGSGEIA